MDLTINTNRQSVNRHSDFTLRMSLLKDGEPYTPTSFVMAFYVDEWDCETVYTASLIGGEFINCSISGDVISVYFDHPHFPLGTLKCRVVDKVRDINFKDGTFDTVTPITLPVEIVTGGGTDSVDVGDVTIEGSVGYMPPVGGIPKADLADDVQASLGKADTALQSYTETDPTVPSWAKQPNKPTYTAQEVGALPADTPIPTKTSDLENDSGFVTSTAMTTALAGKQDTLTFDNTPTAGSNNPVKSGGIKTAIDAVTPTIDPTTKKWIVGGQLTNVIAEGQDGQDGNSGVASADGVESVNNLNGGTTDTAERVYVLGANQGKRLRDQIEYVYQRLQSVYSALGNIAFWDGKTPIANILPDLDWGAPKHTVTLALSLINAVVKHNGVAVANGGTILVEEGSTLTLLVEPASGYELETVTSSTDSATVADLGNGTYSVAVVMGGSNLTLNVVAQSAAPILFEKAKMYVISKSPNMFAFRTSITSPGDVSRACVTVLRSDTSNPCAWSPGQALNVDYEAQALYSAIPIPSGTTKISIKCNTQYYFFPALANASGTILNTNTQWIAGTKTEWNMANYPTATHFAASFKIGDAGTTEFTNETYESMGIELTFE